MPDWSSFKQKYVIEPDDLPNPHGPNVVVIESIDSEEYTDVKTKEVRTRHNLYLAGWDKPLRLNNTRVDIIKHLFGPTTEQAIGGKIALLVGMSNAYGETRPVITIHAYAPNQDAEPAPVPDRCATRSQMRLAQAREYGVSFAAAQKRLAGGPSPQAATGGPHGAHAANAAGGGTGGGVQAGGEAKLGYETAANIGVLLKERNRDWEFLTRHFTSSAMEHLVTGATPADWPHASKGAIWNVLKNLPVVNKVQDAEALRASLIAGWKPTLAQEAAKAKQEDDDIPF